MVLVELGGLEDISEREQYLEFLAENDIDLVPSRDGSYYTAEITLVEDHHQNQHQDEQQEQDDKRSWKSERKDRIHRDQQLDSSMAQDYGEGKRKQKNSFSCYTKFCSLITNREDPRERSSKWLFGLIFDLYEHFDRQLLDHTSSSTTSTSGESEVGNFEKNCLASAAVKDWKLWQKERKPKFTQQGEDMGEIFPSFVMDHLVKRYGLRKIVDQVSWDLVLNIHQQRQSKITVEVFARFLEEYYDTLDLFFFLKLKQVVDKLVQKNVKTRRNSDFFNSKHRAVAAAKQDIPVYLRWADVTSIAKAIYGSHPLIQPGDFDGSVEQEQYQNFLELVDEHSVIFDSQGNRRYSTSSSQSGNRTESQQVIESAQLLHLALAQFHDTRAQQMEKDKDRVLEERKVKALDQVFENAKQVYQEKLGELGFAEKAAKETIERDKDYGDRLDAMCVALKNSLLENDDTRNSLDDVNEKTIRDWGVALLSDHVNKQHVDPHDTEARERDLAQKRQLEQMRVQQRLQEKQSQASNNLPARPQSTAATPSYSSYLEPRPMRSSPPSSPPPPPPSDSPPSSSSRSTDGGQTSQFFFSTTRPKPTTNVASTLSSATMPSRRVGVPSSLSHPKAIRPPTRVAPKQPSEDQALARRVSPPQVVAARISPPGFPSAESDRRSIAPTEMVMREIHGSLTRSKEEYIESLLSSTEGLPTSVTLEIEKELRSQLDRKCRMILNDVIGMSSSGKYLYESSAVASSSRAQLELEFKSILRTFNETGGSYFHMSRQVDEFSRNLLSTAELRQDIEPLVALLVTYASARLGRRLT